MFSPIKLNSLRDNLRKDLERVYNLCKSFYDDAFDLEGIDECLNDLMTAEDDFCDPEDKPYLDAIIRFRNVLLRYLDICHILPKLETANTVLLYDFIVHPILFTNWDWRKEKEEWNIDFRLSSSDIYDGLLNCNPDAVKICLSKLDNCPIADIEYLQETFEKGQKEDFVNKLKTFNNIDIAVLHFVASIFHFRNSLLTVDLESLCPLLRLFGIDETIIKEIPAEEVLDIQKMIAEFGTEDTTDEEDIKQINYVSDFLEQAFKKVFFIFGVFKDYFPSALDALHPFDFERKYLQDVLNDPLFKSCLDKYPISSYAFLGSQKREDPDVQEPSAEVKTSSKQKKQKEQNSAQNNVEGNHDETITDEDNAPVCQCCFDPNLSTVSFENLRKRTLDDFLFVKEAGFIELHRLIKDAISDYNEERLNLFVLMCRYPVEQALDEVFIIINKTDKKDRPKEVAKRISRLRAYFSDKTSSYLYPDFIENAFTDYNQTVRQYHHRADQIEKTIADDSKVESNLDKLNKDAQFCYKELALLCHWLVWFKEHYSKHIEIRGKINFDAALAMYNKTKSRLPEIGSIANKLLPDYNELLYLSIDEKERYRKSLDLDLKSLYDQYQETAKTVCDEYSERLCDFCDVENSPSHDIISAFEKVKERICLLPRLATVMHLYSYFTVVHPILFDSLWAPDELMKLPFAGDRLTAETIYTQLVNSNSFSVRILLSKLKCPLAAIEILQKDYDERQEKDFVNKLKSLTCDISFLHDYASFIPFLVKRDYGLLITPKETAEELSHTRIASLFPHPLFVNQESIFLDPPSEEISIERKLEWLNSVSKSIDISISSFMNALVSETNNNEWKKYYAFEKEYITSILEDPGLQDYLRTSSDSPTSVIEETTIKSTTVTEDIQQKERFPFSLPDNLFKPESNYSIDQKNKAAHFKTKYEIELHGGGQFAKMIQTIASFGFIDPSDRNLRLFTYILTGRFKPKDYQDGEKIEWLDTGYGYELLYVIKYIIGNEKGKYKKVKTLFSGPQWLGKGEFKDQADYADAGFRKALNALYPNECQVKGHVETVREPASSGDWSWIPTNQSNDK